MMYKSARLALVKVAVLLAIVLVFLFITNSIVSMQKDAAEDDLTKLNAQVMQLKGKLTEISTEKKVRDEAKKFFVNYKSSDSADPESFTRDRARGDIASMRKRFGLNSIQLSHTGFKEIKHELVTEHAIALASYATIRFTASYDMPLYELVAFINDSLPGIINISSISIKRTGTPDEQALKSISEGNEVNLVAGEVSFNWFGVVDPQMAAPVKALSEDNNPDIDNIFSEMSKVAGNLDKTVLSEKAKKAPAKEENAPEKAAADAKAAPAKPAPAAKPLDSITPAKQLPAPAKPVAKPQPATSAPAVKTTNPKAPQKLQSVKPSASIEDKKGGADAN